VVLAAVSRVRSLVHPAMPEQVTPAARMGPGLLVAPPQGLVPLTQVHMVLPRGMEPQVARLAATGPLLEDKTALLVLLVAVTGSAGKPMLSSMDTATGSMDPSTVPHPRATGLAGRELPSARTVSVIPAAALEVTVLGLWITGTACSAVCLAGRCHPEPADRGCLWSENITWSMRTSRAM